MLEIVCIKMLGIKSQHLIWVGPLSCREWRWMEIYTDVAEHYTMVANWTKKCKYVWLDEQKWKDHPKVKTLLFYFRAFTIMKRHDVWHQLPKSVYLMARAMMIRITWSCQLTSALFSKSKRSGVDNCIWPINFQIFSTPSWQLSR